MGADDGAQARRALDGQPARARVSARAATLALPVLTALLAAVALLLAPVVAAPAAGPAPSTDGTAAAARDTAATTGAASAASGAQERPSPAPVVYDGWFVDAPAGMQMRANERLTRARMLPLYLGGDLADAVRAAGFRSVRTRTYSAGSTGTVAFKVIRVRRPDRLLADLDSAEPGLGRRFRGLPKARLRTNVTQMESTRAHDVFAHFATITFKSPPYVVEVEAMALNRAVARRTAAEHARAQHDLLQARPG